LNSHVVSKIREKFPNHLFVGEESVSMGKTEELVTNEPTWIIDPIDGTTNFVAKLPFICISIGFSVNKEVLFGVIYNPILDDMYVAQKGKGASRNGNPIHVSHCDSLKNAVVATGFPYDRSDDNLEIILNKLKKVLQACRCVRRFGSAALDMCMVASGQLDFYYERGVHAWDIAAGSLIVLEAGGVVMSIDGENFDLCKRQICVSNNLLGEEVRKLVR